LQQVLPFERVLISLFGLVHGPDAERGICHLQRTKEAREGGKFQGAAMQQSSCPLHKATKIEGKG